ncbi:MAG: hypothetical protein WC673_01655 [Candidatus Paceibacterota bacterium]|jgi:hypothetical protein
MKFLKIKGTTILLFLFAIVLMPVFSFAVDDVTISATIDNPLSAGSLFCFLKDILDVFLTVGIIIAVLFMVYAGFLFVTARGAEAQLTTAKKAFLGAVIGTAIIMGVWVIAQAIVGTINAIRDPGAAISISTCP